MRRAVALGQPAVFGSAEARFARARAGTRPDGSGYAHVIEVTLYLSWSAGAPE